jgi:hypothetical protein
MLLLTYRFIGDRRNRATGNVWRFDRPATFWSSSMRDGNADRRATERWENEGGAALTEQDKA